MMTILSLTSFKDGIPSLRLASSRYPQKDVKRIRSNIDPNIFNCVIALNAMGFQTLSSCEGQRSAHPLSSHCIRAYLMFKDCLPEQIIERAKESGLCYHEGTDQNLKTRSTISSWQIGFKLEPTKEVWEANFTFEAKIFSIFGIADL